MKRFLINDCNLRQLNDSFDCNDFRGCQTISGFSEDFCEASHSLVPYMAQQKQTQEKVRERNSAAGLKCGPREMKI